MCYLVILIIKHISDMFFPFCLSQQYPTIPEDIMLQLQANNLSLLLMEQYNKMQKNDPPPSKGTKIVQIIPHDSESNSENDIEWQSADLRSAFIDFMYGHAEADIDCHKDSTLIANLYQLA